MTASFDVITNGRLDFGIGAGHRGEEHLAYGIPFPRTAIRVKRLREAVTVIKLMWSEAKPSFKGAYYQIQDAICDPKPIQKPHPPILIAGAGEQFTLRLVAELADACNFPGSPQMYKHRLDVLRKHCEAVGRNYDEIKKTLSAETHFCKKQRGNWPPKFRVCSQENPES